MIPLLGTAWHDVPGLLGPAVWETARTVPVGTSGTTVTRSGSALPLSWEV